MADYLTKRGKESYDRLTELIAEVTNLQQAAGVLFWDQQTNMPPGGAQARGNHMAALRKVVHEKFTSPEIGELLEALAGETTLPYDSDEAATIRVARREYDRATKFPPDFVVRLSRAQSAANTKWLEAREANDFHVFRPALEDLVALLVESTGILGYEEHPMDALLDQTEPGIRVSHLEPLFAELRTVLVPLAKAISDNLDAVDDRILHQPFDRTTQLEAAREAIEAIGFDLKKTGRMDLSVHPFTTSFSPNDVRVTTRVQDNFFNACFFACLHEAGHGTYMRGIPLEFESSILGDGASSGMHESQSRLWENLVGRSRAFWEFFYPRLITHFPDQLGGVPMETFYKAVNKVEPSLIRVEADEVTYNLHIMVRFELEKAVFDGKLSLRDMPEAWAAKMSDYLGVRPPDDLAGALQDIHWTFVLGAGFPGYTIGNVASVQLYEKVLQECPDLEARLARGEFAYLLSWMNQNVHAHAAKFTPQELLERVTGRPLTAGPYLKYITDKFSDIYRL